MCLRRTQASLGHKEGVDPKVAADQRGHAIGVAIDTYTMTDLERAGGKRSQRSKKRCKRDCRSVFEVNEVKCLRVESAKPLKDWSGRRGSNPRRPAWENGPCFVFSNITAHGVDSGYGKRQQNRGPFRLVCNGGFLEGAGLVRFARSRLDDRLRWHLSI